MTQNTGNSGSNVARNVAIGIGALAVVMFIIIIVLVGQLNSNEPGNPTPVGPDMAMTSAAQAADSAEQSAQYANAAATVVAEQNRIAQNTNDAAATSVALQATVETAKAAQDLQTLAEATVISQHVQATIVAGGERLEEIAEEATPPATLVAPSTEDGNNNTNETSDDDDDEDDSPETADDGQLVIWYAEDFAYQSLTTALENKYPNATFVGRNVCTEFESLDGEPDKVYIDHIQDNGKIIVGPGCAQSLNEKFGNEVIIVAVSGLDVSDQYGDYVTVVQNVKEGNWQNVLDALGD